MDNASRGLVLLLFNLRLEPTAHRKRFSPAPSHQPSFFGRILDYGACAYYEWQGKSLSKFNCREVVQLDLSNPSTIQNVLSLVILVIAIISIFINWRTNTPAPTESKPNNNGYGTNGRGGNGNSLAYRDQNDAWERLYHQLERECERKDEENERLIGELNTKLAARDAEVKVLRELVDRTNSPIDRAQGVNVNVSNQGQGASAGQTGVGKDIGQESK